MFSGCSIVKFLDNNENKYGDIRMESNFNNYSQMFSGEIVIYNLTRNDIISFLRSPSYEQLKEKSRSINTYSTAGQRYQTSNASLFVIQQSFLDFFGSYKEIQKYVAEKGVNGQIESMAVIDAVSFPITLWVKTTTEIVYITVNDSINDLFLDGEESVKEIYNYRCYSEIEFCQKYGEKEAKLIVNGKEISCENMPIIYYDDADIPLLEVLTALGSEITYSNSETKISLNDEIFYLNIEERKLYKKGVKTKNLLGQIEGGAIIIYSKGNDLMVNKAVLINTLGIMGENVKVLLNQENRSIVIS